MEAPTAPAVHAEEAERAVLGAILNVEDAIGRIGALQAQDFQRIEHQIIFHAIRALEKKGDPIDRVTVSGQLRRHEKFSDFPNLLDYVGDIEEENFSSERLEHYAGIVLNSSVQRRLLRACQSIIDTAKNPKGRDAAAILDEAEQSIRDVSDASLEGNRETVSLSSAAWDAMQRIEDLQERRKENKDRFWVVGTPTGYQTLDKKTSGMQKGELVILAGSPSMGKTSFAMNVALRVAQGGIRGTDGSVIAVFSMEMAAEQLAMRMFSVHCKVDLKKVSTADLSDAEFKKVTAFAQKIGEYKLFIHESSAATPSLIQRISRRVKAQNRGRLDLVIIDYLQLVRSEVQSENRNIELSHITRELKSIAIKLDTPVLCLSQLNRLGAKREAGDAPKLQELRDSGSIEQDADVVMFLYRSPGQDEAEAAASDHVVTTLSVAKNRNGPTFLTEFVFTKPYTLFEEYAGPTYEGEAP